MKIQNRLTALLICASILLGIAGVMTFSQQSYSAYSPKAEYTVVVRATGTDAVDPLAKIKAAAKREVDSERKSTDSDGVNKIADDTKKKIDAATSEEEIEEIKNDGIKRMNDRRFEDCEYCGQEHTGPLAPLTKFIHYLLFRIKKLFR